MGRKLHIEFPDGGGAVIGEEGITLAGVTDVNDLCEWLRNNCTDCMASVPRSYREQLPPAAQSENGIIARFANRGGR